MEFKNVFQEQQKQQQISRSWDRVSEASRSKTSNLLHTYVCNERILEGLTFTFNFFLFLFYKFWAHKRTLFLILFASELAKINDVIIRMQMLPKEALRNAEFFQKHFNVHVVIRQKVGFFIIYKWIKVSFLTVLSESSKN